MNPHKHKDLIIAWANGAQIEFRYFNEFEQEWGKWNLMRPDCGEFESSYFAQYRLKPPADIVLERRIHVLFSNGGMYAEFDNNALSGLPNNVSFTFDGTTFEPKSMEIIK